MTLHIIIFAFNQFEYVYIVKSIKIITYFTVYVPVLMNQFQICII